MRIRETHGPAEAPAVFLVHGAGLAGWMWRPQLEELGRGGRWRLIVVDLADHGTDRGTPFVSIAAEADALAALIASNTEGDAWLVGHSLGARIVLEVLCRRPGVVRGAAVSSALVRPSPLVTMMQSHTVNTISLWMLRCGPLARLQAAQLGFPSQEMTEAYLADVAAMDVGNLDRPLQAFAGSLSPPPGLGSVNCPVLITAGALEPAAMRRSADDLAGLIPGARLAVIDGARHNYPWSHPAAYNALLVEHLPRPGLTRPGRQ